MMIQEAMHKAVAGGYHIASADGADIAYNGANDDFSAWTRTDTESSFMVPVEETWLDPRFWHALGRTLGWSEGCDLAITCVHDDEEGQSGRGSYWMYQWHCFIQAIADGHTPSAFFAQLPSSPTRSSEPTHRHQAETDRPRRACLSLLIAETRQHAQRLCDEAARAQQAAHAARRLAQCARQRRQSEHVERALWREHCGVKCSTPERVLIHAFPAV